jgi:hypothetical protein
MQGRRAAGAGNCVAATGDRGELGLEPRRERPQREDVAPQDLGDQLQLTVADVWVA